ncbi:hypothetical protein Tco_0232326 [Tanacetum coccineum]
MVRLHREIGATTSSIGAMTSGAGRSTLVEERILLKCGVPECCVQKHLQPGSSQNYMNCLNDSCVRRFSSVGRTSVKANGLSLEALSREFRREPRRHHISKRQSIGFGCERISGHMLSSGANTENNLEICIHQEEEDGNGTLFPRLNGFFFGTDIAKITRKRSKPDKHGHGNRKSAQEMEALGDCGWQMGSGFNGGGGGEERFDHGVFEVAGLKGVLAKGGVGFGCREGRENWFEL